MVGIDLITKRDLPDCHPLFKHLLDDFRLELDSKPTSLVSLFGLNLGLFLT